MNEPEPEGRIGTSVVPDTVEQAWRNVELILKVNAIGEGFSEEFVPEIKARMEEAYSSAFEDALRSGKSVQEAHWVAMSCLDDEAALRRGLDGIYLTKQEDEIARTPGGFLNLAFLPPMISAVLTLAIFWREIETAVHDGRIYAVLVASVIAGLVSWLHVIAHVTAKRLESRTAIVLHSLVGFFATFLYASALYLLVGWKGSLCLVLLSIIPTLILIMIGRKLYRKTRS